MKLSLIIPIYNEEAILAAEVERLVAQMKEVLPEIEYELLLVENGSHDRTRAIAEELASRHTMIRAFHLPDAGYGPAMKHGLLQARGEFVVLFNIDFWDIEFIRKALALQDAKNLDMVVGSKTMQGAEDTRPFVRRLITRTFNGLLRFVFGFHGTDTHGMKLLRRDKMLPIIQQCKTEREIFDTEFVMRAQHAGLKTEEIPVVCEERRKTTYAITKRIPRTVKDLLVLFFSLRFLQFNRIRMMALLAGIIFFIASAAWEFPDSPSPWFDQGVNLGIAKTFVEDGVYSLRLAPGQYVENRPLMISTNYPMLGWIILAFKLFGVGLAQAQVVMILSLITYLIISSIAIYRWYGAKYVPWSIALAATFLPFYGHGMSGGLGEVAGLVYFLIALRLIKKEKKWKIFLCGIFLGLCASTKIFYLSVLGAVGVSEFVLAVRQKHIPWKRWGFLMLGAAIPLLLWLRTLLPDGFTIESIRSAAAYYQNPYNVERVVGANIVRFITETTPLHFALLAGTYFVMVILVARKKVVRQAEFVILLFLVLNTVFFVRTVGWYRYLFPAHLLALTFFPAALDRIIGRVKQARVRTVSVSVALVALILVQGIHLSRERFGRIYYNPAPREFASLLDHEYAGADIFVIDHPELWFLLKNENARQYLQMNPYVAFGEDVFASGNLPRYLVSGEPAANAYLLANREPFESMYQRITQYDAYVLFERTIHRK
jgi:glycosyltransferase involved in cell wall biosynthesis